MEGQQIPAASFPAQQFAQGHKILETLKIRKLTKISDYLISNKINQLIFLFLNTVYDPNLFDPCNKREQVIVSRALFVRSSTTFYCSTQFSISKV